MSPEQKAYIAIAKIGLHDEAKRQIADLKAGLGHVVGELHDRGVSLDDIEREFESACEEIRWLEDDEERSF